MGSRPYRHSTWRGERAKGHDPKKHHHMLKQHMVGEQNHLTPEGHKRRLSGEPDQTSRPQEGQMGARPYRHSTWTCGNWPKATDPGNRAVERRNYAQQVPKKRESRAQSAETQNKQTQNEETKPRKHEETTKTETPRTRHDETKHNTNTTKTERKRTQSNGTKRHKQTKTTKPQNRQTRTAHEGRSNDPPGHSPERTKRRHREAGGPMTPVTQKAHTTKQAAAQNKQTKRRKWNT